MKSVPTQDQHASKAAHTRYRQSKQKVAHSNKSCASTPGKKNTVVDIGEKPSPSSPVVNQGLENLLEMIRPKRQALLKGPRITIHIGDTSVTSIAKRAAMAASLTLQRHFAKNPQSMEYRFSRGQIHPGAVRLLLIGWMQDTCNEFEAHAIPSQKTFAEDIALLRAARLLGMQDYCPHIMTEYINYLKSELPSYEEIVAVEKNAKSDNDPLWTTMVNHLCHDRHKGLIHDVEEFEQFLEEHPRLKNSMKTADAFFAKYAKQRAEVREAERRQRWERNQAERRQKVRPEQTTAESLKSLKKKLDTKSSGLLTVTADEAELLRGRSWTR